MESFYMVMASNASTDLYSENSLVKFKNELPQPINVEGFKIALQSMYLDNKYGNVPNGVLGTRSHFILFLTAGNTENEVEPTATCIISEYYMTIHDVVAVLEEQLTPNGVNSVKFEVSAVNSYKRLEITLRNAILLVHPEVNKWLHLTDELPITYRGEPYYKLQSSPYRVHISKTDFSTKPIAPSIIKVQLQEMNRNLSETDACRLDDGLCVSNVYSEYCRLI